MPRPGEQHASIANPFEEPQRRVSEYTAQEVAVLQSRLEKQLGPEYLSARSGPSGQKVHYIAAEKCIALANEVFGFNGWSSSIQNIQVDFVDEHPQTLKISLGLSVIIRVTLRDGTFHEDIGYGHIENCKGKAAAFEKAKKEGTTDALKRALRNFGNVMGNCIYDKSYLAKVTKMKVEPTKFDETGLHRHADHVKREQKEAARIAALKPDTDVSQPRSGDSFEDIFGEFDEVDFSVVDDDHPDEITLPNPNPVQTSSNEKTPNQPTTNQPAANQPAANQPAANVSSMQPPSRPLGRSISGGHTYTRAPQTPNQPASRSQFNGGQNPPAHAGLRPQQQQLQQNRPQPQQLAANTSREPNHGAQPHQTPPKPPGPNGPAAGAETTGFFSARAVNQLPEESLISGPVVPQAGQIFNPRAESPSIRKTPGIDHTKSKPLSRTGQHIPPPSTQSDSTATAPAPAPAPAAPAPAGPGANAGAGGMAGRTASPQPQMASAGRPGIINPQLDQARRIGAPGGPGSPLANRSQYRPPTIIHKRQHPSDAGAATGAPGGLGRAPLADVSNNSTGAAGMGSGGPDIKRPRMA